MNARASLAVIAMALSGGCSEQRIVSRTDPHEGDRQIAALYFRQIYDADELAIRLRSESGRECVLAEVLSSHSIGTVRSHYMRLAPHRPEPVDKTEEMVVCRGRLRLLIPEGPREVSFVFPMSRTGARTFRTGEQHGGEREEYAYNAAEWESGYYPAHTIYVRPVVLVLAMTGISMREGFIEGSPPSYVPPTYVMPLEWRADIAAVLADWPKLPLQEEHGGSLSKAELAHEEVQPFRRLIAWQILLAGEAQGRLGSLAIDDLRGDSVYVGALTYHVMRYGSEEERAAFVARIGELLATDSKKIDLNAMGMGAAGAYTKCTINPKRIRELRAEVLRLNALDPNLTDAAHGHYVSVMNELRQLDGIYVSPALDRLISMLTPHVSAADAGLSYILQRIVSPNGPQAKYADRTDRDPPVY